MWVANDDILKGTSGNHIPRDVWRFIPKYITLLRLLTL